MTNQHCIASNSDALNTEFEFMGEESSCGATNGNCWMCRRGEIFDAASLVKVSSNKDYALVQLKGGPVGKYGYLDLDNRAANIGEEIYIPQHPGGRAKVCFAYGLCDSLVLLLDKIPY
jgi:lysyl endopeptidase